MTHKFLYILFVVLLISLVQPAQAGFFVKKQMSVAQTSVTIAQNTERGSEISTAKDFVYPGFNGAVYRGWFGIVSVLFGLLGFLYPLFSIGALLFGFLGMNRHNRDTGFAIAGFILGLTVLALTIFFGYIPLAPF